SVPLKARPTGVRTEEAITTSRIRTPLFLDPYHFRLLIYDFGLLNFETRTFTRPFYHSVCSPRSRSENLLCHSEHSEESAVLCGQTRPRGLILLHRGWVFDASNRWLCVPRRFSLVQ